MRRIQYSISSGGATWFHPCTSLPLCGCSPSTGILCVLWCASTTLLIWKFSFSIYIRSSIWLIGNIVVRAHFSPMTLTIVKYEHASIAPHTWTQRISGMFPCWLEKWKKRHELQLGCRCIWSSTNAERRNFIVSLQMAALFICVGTTMAHEALAAVMNVAAQ